MVSWTHRSPTLRSQAHLLCSRVLHAHPSDAARLHFIRHMLAQPRTMGRFRESAVHWLKDELLRANRGPASMPPVPARSDTAPKAAAPAAVAASASSSSSSSFPPSVQAPLSRSLPFSSSGLFSQPSTLESLAPFVFPDLSGIYLLNGIDGQRRHSGNGDGSGSGSGDGRTTAVDDDDDEDKDDYDDATSNALACLRTLELDLPFYLAALNLYYLLCTAPELRVRLNVPASLLVLPLLHLRMGQSAPRVRSSFTATAAAAAAAAATAAPSFAPASSSFSFSVASPSPPHSFASATPTAPTLTSSVSIPAPTPAPTPSGHANNSPRDGPATTATTAAAAVAATADAASGDVRTRFVQPLRRAADMAKAVALRSNSSNGYGSDSDDITITTMTTTTTMTTATTKEERFWPALSLPDRLLLEMALERAESVAAAASSSSSSSSSS
jgi:hypothetical protein